ncbi:hypothetical protein JCM11641_002359 [Rhodosporidiobolus odoratus]
MGLAKLGISIQDCFKPNLAFEVGQETDALEHLGDPQDSTGLTTWQEIWKHRHIDGVLLVTAANQRALARAVEKVLKHLGHSILLLKRKNGSVRPDEQADHEHFGCLDSVSRPTVIGYNDARRAPGETASLPSAQRRQKEELDGE